MNQFPKMLPGLFCPALDQTFRFRHRLRLRPFAEAGSGNDLSPVLAMVLAPHLLQIPAPAPPPKKSPESAAPAPK